MTRQVDDAILVESAQDGDVDAFEALVKRHEDSVYRVALRMLGSRADAQDISQETFVRVWRYLHRFRHQSALNTWVYRITTRCCLDFIAARRPTGEPLELEQEIGGADPAESAEQRERLRAVTRAITGLPPEQRAALVLREFEGLSYEDVGEVLGVSVAAVKGRIHRARRGVLDQTVDWR